MAMNKKIMKSDELNFKPSVFIRNRHLQSILASSRLRNLGKNSLLSKSQELIITTSGGTRLLSFLSPQANPKGLIIMMHGWEGSSSSAYVVAAGKYFFDLGFSVCRLNLRDHGESHHLNEGLFHGALTEETFEAISQLALRADKFTCIYYRLFFRGEFRPAHGPAACPSTGPGIKAYFRYQPAA